jgi:hypothetical protein
MDQVIFMLLGEAFAGEAFAGEAFAVTKFDKFHSVKRHPYKAVLQETSKTNIAQLSGVHQCLCLIVLRLQVQKCQQKSSPDDTEILT